ncbi:hypothetical protein ACFX13_031104 [Malus domestica]
MHEFRLDRKLAMRIKSNSRTSDGNEYVVCRVQKNYDRKRNVDDHEETRVVESQRNKIQRQFENIDESYATPLSSEVVDKVNTDHCPQKQQPQQEQQTNLNANSTSSSIGVTNVDQRKYDYYEDQPKYYEPQNSHVSPISSVVVGVIVDPYYNQQQLELCNVTEFPQYYNDSQEPMARPDDFVAEAACPTMPSSLGMANQEEHLQHNGFVNNGMDLPQYDYSSTQDPSNGTVFCHYDPPQTATTGFANQPHHIVTQDQPNYFVADPTVGSSLASQANIDQNHPVMRDKNQHPLLNFDYSQFYEVDGDDIMIVLDDLWNNMVQPAAVLS